jgi:hypothetical protein
MMRLYVGGIGLRAPGLDGWAASRRILAGDEPYAPTPLALPSASLLPANERRRAPQIVKLALATGAEAFDGSGRTPAETPAIFASSGADGETIHAILETLAGTERELSPTRFHNSVHNVAAGLIEAAAQAMGGAAAGAVVLIAYDLPYPGPLGAVRRIAEPFGVAFVLAADRGGHAIGQIEIDLISAPAAPSPASPAALEALRRSVPAARCLPLLAALASGRPAALTLDYLDDLALALRVTPGGGA